MPNFFVFLLILFLIAALLRVEFFFTVVYFLGAVYLFSHLWMRGTQKRLRVQRRFLDHAFFGDRVVVDLQVHNRGWLPIPWLSVHDSLPVQLATPPFHRQVLSLGAREKKTLHYTLSCHQRGYYAVGPLSVQTGDLLGIVRSRLERIESSYLIVYPRVLPLQQLFEDPSRVMGVRDYRRGDSPRRIHWTATASAGRLLVKQYQPAVARETLICLDLDQEGYGRRQRYTATELAIVVAASLANHIVVHEGLPVGLTTEAWDPLANDRAYFFLPPRPERAHLMSLLEVLARAQVTSGTSFPNLLRRGSMNLPWGATLSVITGRQSEGLFDTLVYLRRAGFAVALILVQPTPPPPALRERADLMGVPIHKVWQDGDLEAWR
jgi:uncharacterized protein (DUF58 family)